MKSGENYEFPIHKEVGNSRPAYTRRTKKKINFNLLEENIRVENKLAEKAFRSLDNRGFAQYIRK